MSRSAFSESHHHDDDQLRDPTKEELYNGPKREKLPMAIQQMAQDDTACTFCGVSYFVFSEVQELQSTVKQYKKTFHEFVRFMERERKIAQDLKVQVIALKKGFDDAASLFATQMTQVANETHQLRSHGEQLTKELRDARQQTDTKQHEFMLSQSQYKRAEEEWKLASAMTEQKMRNEILHLSSQVEKCKLLTASQEAEFQTEMEKERALVKELELQVANARASMSTQERQAITERDVLKQQLLAATDRVTSEKEISKQLEKQLKLVQQELQRVVASSDSEKTAFATLQSEIASLKLQITQYDKAKTTWVHEKSDFQEQLTKANETVRLVRQELAVVEKNHNENAASMATHKQEFARELEKMRLAHSQAINRMQRDHQNSVDELKKQQKTYIEYLQKQTTDDANGKANAVQHALLEMEKKLQHTDKQVAYWKHQAQQTTEELQHLRVAHQHSTTLLHSTEKQLTELRSEQRDWQNENDKLQRLLEQSSATAKQQVEETRREVTSHCKQQFERQQSNLQKQLEVVQGQYDQLQQDHEQLKKRHKLRNPEEDNESDHDTAARSHSLPQHAWGDGSSSSSSSRERRGNSNIAKTSASTTMAKNDNQDRHQNEADKALVESLRRVLDQKDREIALLQQTVHRECLERTSLLEKMRSGKVLPDLSPSVMMEASMRRSSASMTPRRDHPNPKKASTTNPTENDESEEQRDGGGNTDVSASAAGAGDPSQPKAASFYERLRRAGQKKPKLRKNNVPQQPF